MRAARKLKCDTCHKEGHLTNGMCVKCRAVAWLRMRGLPVDPDPLDVDKSRENQWRAADRKYRMTWLSQ